MNDKKNSDNIGNASSREVPYKNSDERGPSEQPPVKKRRHEFKPQCSINEFSVRSLVVGDIATILSALDCGKDVTICDKFGRNAMHYASLLNWFNVVEAIVSKPYCRDLIDSLTRRRKSPLVIAAQNSHKNIVEYLLMSGANFRFADDCGRTVLHFASEKGWLDIVQEVVNKGMDIDVLTSKNETALIIAAKHSKEELVSFYIGAKANCDYCDNKGRNILHFSSKHGWLKTVLAVVQNIVDINATTAESDTALLLAAKFKQEDIVKALIDLGANVHCCDSDGWNLVHYASSYGWLDVVVSAVEKGADIESKTKISETPILLAAKNSHKDIVRFFIYLGVKFNCADECNKNMLLYSSKNGWIDIAEYAVEKRGLDPNTETAEHKTALQLASRHNKKDVASFLISVGANIHFTDPYGWTILHFAAAYGWCDLAQRVLNQVDINAKTTKCDTVLEIACKHLQKEFVIFLIDAGVDIHCTDKDKKTVLHHAAQHGWLGVARSAVKKGACIDSLSADNETALLLAAQHSRPAFVRLLIKFGANVNLFDSHGQTVLHYAAEKGWPKVTNAVIKKGGDINVMNDTCDTPLHLACMCEKIEVLKCLLEAGADFKSKRTARFAPFTYACRKNYIIDTPANVEAVQLFIDHGAYPGIDDFFFILETSLLKEGILCNEKACAQAVINKYNNQDLPRLYSLPFSNRLPPIKNVHILTGPTVRKEIEHHVKQKINTKGYCDLPELYYARPPTLSMMSLYSILMTFRNLVVL